MRFAILAMAPVGLILTAFPAPALSPVPATFVGATPGYGVATPQREPGPSVAPYHPSEAYPEELPPTPSPAPAEAPSPRGTPAPAPGGTPLGEPLSEIATGPIAIPGETEPALPPTPVELLHPVTVHGQIFGRYAVNTASGFNAFDLTRTFLTATAYTAAGVFGTVTLDTYPGPSMPGAFHSAFARYGYVQIGDPAIPGRLRLGLQPTLWFPYEWSKWGDWYAVTFDLLGDYFENPFTDFGVDYKNGWGPLGYDLMIVNGEGLKSFETDGEKTYEALITYDTPLPHLQLALQLIHANPLNPALDPTAVVNPAIAPAFTNRDFGTAMASYQTPAITLAALYDLTDDYGSNGAVYQAWDASAFAVLHGNLFAPSLTRWQAALRLDHVVNGNTSAATYNAATGVTTPVDRTLAGIGYSLTKDAVFMLADQTAYSEDGGTTLFNNTAGLYFSYTW